MKRTILALAAAAASLVLAATPAAAQANRTFVSGHGSDSNPGTLELPVRSFQRAHDLTNPGGEITVLDPAGYGPVTITKSISIVNDPQGVGYAGVTAAAGGDAITIAAGPDDVVNLRGLTLNGGGGAGNNGVTFTSGGALNMQWCWISGFGVNGLNLMPSGSSKFNISHTTIIHNDANGILISPTGTNAKNEAFFTYVGSAQNGAGVFVDGFNASGGTLAAVFTDSDANGNGGNGFGVASSSGHAAATLTIVRGHADDQSIGFACIGAEMYLTESGEGGNKIAGFSAVQGGIIFSGGDNEIRDTNNFGSLTPLGLE